MATIFNDELEFEKVFIKVLQENGRKDEVLHYPTEEDLIENRKNIIFENNRGIDQFNDCRPTDNEMEQIMSQVRRLKDPLEANEFINGGVVTIKRDNQKDKLHYGTEITVSIFNKYAIAGGNTRYQIAEQPVFKGGSFGDRRGDVMLLINGIPVIHVELKKSNVSYTQARNQIKKYIHEGVFSGIFSLIQVFVAMSPEESVYFANPGDVKKLNSKFSFHWEDANNEIVNDWKQFTVELLNIPMAHQLIGSYTIPDQSDGNLKVMRSYQINATQAIIEKVNNITDWSEPKQLGGYIWHTTGSGKTMTSFKTAQLIADTKIADKVVFLTDRVELGTQTFLNFTGFAGNSRVITETESTDMLISKLAGDDIYDDLIIASIQKMSRIKKDDVSIQSQINKINKKHLVIIIDEAHRDTFGEMVYSIKNTFPNAIFFGFTGTPIFENNQKKKMQTSDVFGSELSRYTIADGIRDENVLGFTLYKLSTFKEHDLREVVALEKCKCRTEDEAIADESKSKIFYHYMQEVPMIDIEKNIKSSQYNTKEHREQVVDDIIDNWNMLSKAGKFHAIFATNSIPEALKYYKLFKEKGTNLRISLLVDSHFDNTDDVIFKEDSLKEVIDDYNRMFGQQFRPDTYDGMKTDISHRLAHKDEYKDISDDKTLNILIVVNQMLTGFDSKRLNTLYVDKVLEHENVIQAFSRTNRVFGDDKSCGIIKYYRKPHTMAENIAQAIKDYSGDREFDIFVPKLHVNISELNKCAKDIIELFIEEKITDLEKNPTSEDSKAQFAKLFNKFNKILETAKVQGFTWDKDTYVEEVEDENGKTKTITTKVDINENTYNTLVQRYKELFGNGGGGGGGSKDVPYEIEGYIVEMDTSTIDTNYMNSKFDKYLKALRQENVSEEEKENLLGELHRSYAWLSQEEQKAAASFLYDVKNGKQLEPNLTFMDYITEYLHNKETKEFKKVVAIFELDENMLKSILDLHPQNLKELQAFGRFDKLLSTVNKQMAKKYLEEMKGKTISAFTLEREISDFLEEFILNGGHKEGLIDNDA